MDTLFGPLNFVVLIILAGVLYWSLSLVYGRRREKGDDTLLFVLTLVVWLLLLAGVIGSVTCLVLPGATAAALVTLLVIGSVILVIAGMVVSQYRDRERRALIWVLAVSAERGLPLAPAARAFAAERIDEQGRRALRLARLLEAGVPLPRALRQSGHRLPVDAELAVRVDCETRAFGGLLKEAAREGGKMAPVWRSLYEKFLYLTLLFCVASAVTSFLLVAIVPTYREIFDDNELPLPPVTEFVVATSSAVAKFGFVLVPVYVALLTFLFVGVMYYMGWLRWEPGILSRFTRRIDSANIMRTLAHSIANNRSLADTIGALSRCYPKSHVRRRLSDAERSIVQGVPWCDSLLANGLLVQADAAVLRSAERVGNLEWALREMADSTSRRWAYRIMVFMQVGLPLALLCFAVPVALVVVAFIFPLAQLVSALSHG